MKYLAVSLLIAAVVISLPKSVSPNTFVPALAETAELPMCPPGTVGDQDGCQLDPNDCSRGIDESNQESCDPA